MKNVIRIVKFSNKYYGRHIDINNEDDLEDINIFVDEGTPVILVSDISKVYDLYDIDIDDIEMVEED